MPGFPTLGGSSSTAPDDLSTAWTRVRVVAGFVKEQSKSLRDRSAVQNIGASEILQYVNNLADWKEQIQAIATMGAPLVAYAQQMVASTEDITAEFNAMVAQITATITLIVQTFPVDVSGNILARKWLGTNTGRLTDNQFTPAQLAQLRTQIDVLLTTLN